MIDTLAGHDDAVSCMSLSGDTLATGSWDSAVKAWRVTPSAVQRLPIADFSDHDATVKCLHLDYSANLLASASEDGTVCARMLSLPRAHAFFPYRKSNLPRSTGKEAHKHFFGSHLFCQCYQVFQVCFYHCISMPLFPLTHNNPLLPRDGSRVLTASSDGRMKLLEFGNCHELLSVDMGEALR